MVDFAHFVPSAAKQVLGHSKRLYRERRADISFYQRDLPSVSPSTNAPQHVVIVVVDALRADSVREEIAPFLNIQ